MDGMNSVSSSKVTNFYNQPSNRVEWETKPAVAEAKSKPTAKSQNFLSKLFFTPVPSPVACMPSPTNKPTLTETLKQDGGELPLTQPTVKDNAGQIDPVKVDALVPGGQVMPLDSGAIVIVPPPPPGIDGGDPTQGVVILPTNDAGVPQIPEDVWFLTGTGKHFQATPAIPHSSSFQFGSGLQTIDLAVRIGLDSTQVPGMPAGGCFDGLVRMNQLSADDIANELPGCTLPGYTSFVICPGTPGTDLKVYLADYTLQGYRHQDGQRIPLAPATDTLSNRADLYLGKGLLLGSVCGASPNPYYINIPKGYNSDGTLDLDVSLHLYVEAMGKDPNGNFTSALRTSIVASPNPNNTAIDGGTK
ncbi:MAG: hypothetical protein JW873_06435 [Candidatus Saganbacteria bacterium]|nr:hypothetical protein [Candidatus Saganbacteria bacterium]